MKDVLLNMANLLLLTYCRGENIDCSGSRVGKKGRGFTYGLYRISDGEELATVTFKKSSIPQYAHNMSKFPVVAS